MRLPAMVAVVAVALVLGSIAQADVNMNTWGNSWGIYAFGQGAGGSYITNGTLVQLIWSPDNAISPLDGLNPNMLDLSEKLMYVTNGPEAGGWGLIVTDLDDPAGGNFIYNDTTFGVTLANGWIYCRVFDEAVPFTGGHYFESALVDANEWTNVPPVWTSLDITQGGTDPGFAVNQVIGVIPEPMSMALFGLGLVSVAILRRRRK